MRSQAVAALADGHDAKVFTVQLDLVWNASEPKGDLIRRDLVQIVWQSTYGDVDHFGQTASGELVRLAPRPRKDGLGRRFRLDLCFQRETLVWSLAKSDGLIMPHPSGDTRQIVIER
jgi:hypothetical protein